jgi:uncharacterized damage-inducible protein DinB
MNSPQALAQMNRSAAEALGKAAAELGDKITWRPLDKGRNALDQVLECAGFARLGTHIFTHGTVPPMDQSVFEQFHAEHGTPEKALAVLQSATDEFARAIEALPAEKQQNKVTLPFGGGMEKTLVEVALMNYWNTVYHEGQVNYIQTLAAE